MIGATRETGDAAACLFQEEQLLHVKGSTLLIKDKSVLERIVAGH